MTDCDVIVGCGLLALRTSRMRLGGAPPAVHAPAKASQSAALRRVDKKRNRELHAAQPVLDRRRHQKCLLACLEVLAGA